MRSFLFLATLCLALAPLAAAGPGTQVHTLDGQAQCESYGDYQSGGNSTPDGGYQYQYYSYDRHCLDGQNVVSASAQDNNGDVAGAAVGNQHTNSSSYSYNSYSWWDNRSSSSSQSSGRGGTDQWARGATVSSRAGNASVGNGCDAHFSESYGNSKYGGSWGTSQYSSHQDDSASNCGEGAASNVAGTPASAGVANYNCASSSGDFGRQWQDTYGYQSYRHGERSDRCFSGLVANGEGQNLAAGLANGCDSNDWSHSASSWNANDTQGYSQNASWSRCYGGVLAQGPDGSSFFVGQRTSSSGYCSNGECQGWSTSDLVVEIAWEHDPLQPYPIIISQPLP